MVRKYWLHRISHKMEVSYPLLDKGYISIGFSDFVYNRRFLDEMKSDIPNKWEVFENENKVVWGDKLYRTRYNLWRFLCEFSIDDYVVIPSWGTFSVYKIIDKPQFASEVIGQNFSDWNGKPVALSDKYENILTDSNGNVIDIGFVIHVEKIVKDISRSDYAQNDLLSRLKIRQTNADISDLSSLIEDAITRFEKNDPLNIYSETIKKLSDSMKTVIDNIVDNDQFERLIKSYFEKIGADDVYIPSKHDGVGDADGDIVARFDALKLVVYVQAKHHKGTSNEKAVIQISEYADQKNQEAVDSDYNSISWVISSADDFSSTAQSLAIEKNIKLINGEEFRKMLIDAGLSKIAVEFSAH